MAKTPAGLVFLRWTVLMATLPLEAAGVESRAAEPEVSSKP